MKNGAMINIVYSNSDELIVAEEIKKLDDLILHFRQLIRNGEQLNGRMLKERLSALGYAGGKHHLEEERI
jgi:hypothetical protein